MAVKVFWDTLINYLIQAIIHDKQTVLMSQLTYIFNIKVNGDFKAILENLICISV